jgi:outer membrane protein assembly factor BamB
MSSSFLRGRRAVFAAALAGLLAVPAALAAPSWQQPAADAGQSWNNPRETLLKPGNVARLHAVSSLQAGYFQVGPVTQSGGALFFCSDMLGLASIDQATSASLWSRFGFAGGYCNAAVLDGVAAYVTAASLSAGTWTNTLTAVARSDGSNRWQVFGPADDAFPAASFLQFNVPTLAKGTLFASHERSLLSAYDAATGALRWRTRTEFLNNQPAVADGLVFTSTWGEGDGVANRVFAHRAADGTLAWSQPTDASASEYPAAAVAGRVFVGADSGALFAFDAATGAPLWQAQLSGYVSAPPVATAQAVIVNSGLGVVSALDAGTGTSLWSVTLANTDRVASNLVLANGVVYLTAVDFRGDQRLLALDARSGRRLLRLADPIFGSHANVSVAGGRVYVSSEGVLTVYGLP